MAAEMNEQKILALPRTERRMQLSFKEEEEEEEEKEAGFSSLLLVQECASFENSLLPKRRMQGFVSLETVTGIKSAYFLKMKMHIFHQRQNFVKINKLFFVVTLSRSC